MTWVSLLGRAAPVLLAMLIDRWLGDPPNRFHPTAWMGSFIAGVVRRRPRHNPAAELLFGLALMVAGLALCVGAGLLLAWLASRLPVPLQWVAEAVVLKMTISGNGLDRAAHEVQSALEAGNQTEARRLLAWHLVSRDTTQLTEAQMAAATIESVAENTTDGVIAPLCFYILGGLPLALAYRFINTADAMLGYRDVEREWLGKIPARLDDVVNLIPARVAGLLLVMAAALDRAGWRTAWQTMWRDGGRTASPNAGVTMSAMAGALGVELEKVGHYRLGAGLRAPTTADLRRARRIAAWTSALAAGLLATGSLYVGR
jgi:adenosylcobinamide-phosphate synthase